MDSAVPLENEIDDGYETKPENISENVWSRFLNAKEKIKGIRESEKLREERNKGRMKKISKCRHITEDKNGVQDKEDSELKSLQPYIYINNHLTTLRATKRKSTLELKIHNAVKEKRFDEAMQLNDLLSTREFAKVILKACEAKKYDGEKKAEKDKKEKKKKDFAWRFEQKKRWETKGNM